MNRTNIQEANKHLHIQELQQRLQETNTQLQNRNSVIEKLTSDLSLKNAETTTLKEKAKFLEILLGCIPDLKRVVTQMDAIASGVKGKEDYDYIEVSGSSSAADDGDGTASPKHADNTSELILKTKVKDDEIMDSEMTNGIQTVGEMARNFVRDSRIHKFSVSEDINSEEELGRIPSSKNYKEMYF